MKRKSLVITIKNKFPFIVRVGFKEQLDLCKQPLLCIFHTYENKTIRVFEF